MNKELTKEEAEEFYNKLWLENKELIQDNMNKLSMERFELELELVDKDKKIERLNNIINEIEKWLKEKNKFYEISTMGYSYGVIKEVIDKLQELKGSNNNEQ